MPALPSPGSVIKLNLNWGVEGDALAQTIHYFRYSGGAPSAGALSTLCQDAVSSADTEFGPLCSNSVGILAATARDLASAMGNEATAGTPWVGTRGTALLPPGAAMVIAHSISRHYRGGHPRSYLPLGVSGDVALTGLWASAFVTAADTAWGAWIAYLVGTGDAGINALVNVGYYGPPNRTITSSGGRVKTVSSVLATPHVDVITGHVARKNIGSQRRRNRDA
jgi:hypothetical protein